jgi:hypothetical protein
MKLFITVLLSAVLILTLQRTPVNKQVVHRASVHRTTIVQKSSVAQEVVPPQPVKETTQVVSIPPVLSTHEELMTQAGIGQNDWSAAEYIVSHESSWRSSATEPHTGAYGLCQSLPAVKMASAGSDWQSNPVTQLKWCNSYALTRYGGWQEAYTHWTAFRWW